MKAINNLPESKAEKISDFADFVSKKFEKHMLNEALQKMVSQSKSFEFLEQEESYLISDLKEVYNVQR